MEKVVSVALIFLSIVTLFVTNGYMAKTEKIINSAIYEKVQSENGFAVNTRMVGGKKFGADMLFVKQVLDIGGVIGLPPESVRDLSEAISYNDPYFIANYTFSGLVVGMIRTFDKPEYGFEILNRGLKYNPDDYKLLWYLSALTSFTSGKYEEMLIQLEKISKVYKDDTVENTIAYLYERKYKKTNEVRYLNKAIEYWEKLLESKDEGYRYRGKKKLKEYKVLFE